MKCRICHNSDGLVISEDGASATCDGCNTIYPAKDGGLGVFVRLDAPAFDPEGPLDGLPKKWPATTLRFLWLLLNESAPRSAQDETGCQLEWPTTTEHLLVTNETAEDEELAPGLYGYHYPHQQDDCPEREVVWFIAWDDLPKMTTACEGRYFEALARDGHDHAKGDQPSLVRFLVVRVSRDIEVAA